MTYTVIKKYKDRMCDILYYSMGDKCTLCGYNKTRNALDFHHINQTDKKYTLSYMLRVHTFPLEKIVEEAKKCILLCSNCHREYHAGLHNDIILSSSFDNEKYMEILSKLHGVCVVCKTVLNKLGSNFCSRSCNSKYNTMLYNMKKDAREQNSIWRDIDVITLLHKHQGNFCAAAREMNISDNGVRKRFKKITGYTKFCKYLASLK